MYVYVYVRYDMHNCRIISYHQTGSQIQTSYCQLTVVLQSKKKNYLIKNCIFFDDLLPRDTSGCCM